MPARRADRLRVALALIGLLIASYLTLLHYVASVPLVCAAGSVVDCETVLHSPSSVVLGVPVAAWGLLWFVVALTLALLAVRGGQETAGLRGVALAWSFAGTGSVLWLVYQEIGVIGRICAWCTAVHVVVLALLAIQVLEEPSATGAAAPKPEA